MRKMKKRTTMEKKTKKNTMKRMMKLKGTLRMKKKRHKIPETKSHKESKQMLKQEGE